MSSAELNHVDTMLDFIERNWSATSPISSVTGAWFCVWAMRLQSNEARIRAACTIELEGGRSIRSETVLFAVRAHGATPISNLEAVGTGNVDHPWTLGRSSHNRSRRSPTYLCRLVMSSASPQPCFHIDGNRARIALPVQSLKWVNLHAPPEFFPYGNLFVPENFTVGLTEEEVKERDNPYEVGIAGSARRPEGTLWGWIQVSKMIFSLKTRPFAGLSIVGEGCDRTDPYRPGGSHLKGRPGLFWLRTHSTIQPC